MIKEKIGQLGISSPAFKNEGNIPVKYTCDGENKNPPIAISGIPQGTQTLAIIVEDPDTSKGIFDHWVAWNINPASTIPENSVPGVSGKNGAGKTGYHGPCPPSAVHRYFFNVFALDTRLDLEPGSGKESLKAAMKPHILAEGILIGLYAHQENGK